jgi:hypothetical protein
MEIFLLYTKLIFASLVGMGVQLLVKNKSFSDTARKANVEYSFKNFILNDIWSIIWTFLGISAIFLICGDMINNITKHTPDEVQSYLYGILYLSIKDIAIAIITALFLTAGYMGQDFLLRLLSRTSKEMKAAIDYKTTIADTSTGTLDKPTPIK